MKHFWCTSLLAILISSCFQPVYAKQNGAVISDRLKKHIKHIEKKPAESENEITIILIDRDNKDISNLIKQHKGFVKYTSKNQHQITIKNSHLKSFLANMPDSVIVRLPYMNSVDTVVSQGVDITGAIDMHDLAYHGDGIKIGIIDLGFAGLDTSKSAGELPSSLIINDYTGTGTGGIDHGTNVAEIVHDMAPNAQLYLAKISTSFELEAAVNDMINMGVTVINHSVGWFGAAFYDGSGIFCDITNTANNSNIVWVNSAGNSRQSHYLATFTDSDGDLNHDFTGVANFNKINVTAGSAYSLILNWDAYPQTNIDYSIYVYDGDPSAGGALIDFADEPQSGRGSSQFPYPVESLTIVPVLSGTHYIVIKKNSATTANIPLTLFSINKSLVTYTTQSSLTQPADCASSLTVGAVNLTDVPEYFSSEGPTTDGRNKPELVGVDRVRTSRVTVFAGTSAAAPNVAGGIAILRQQNPAMTNSEIVNLATSGSYDLLGAGFDYRTGYGRLSLDADMDLYNHDDDNCRIVYNPLQIDTDLDAQGNVCDADDDNDGLTDILEVSIGSNSLLIDTDGDGLTDYYEVAFDGDAANYSPSFDLNPLSTDTDNDSLFDNIDPIPLTYNFNDGDIAPLGSPDGVVNASDYILATRIIHGEITVTDLELSHGDLYPPGAPDGILNTSDLVKLIQLVK